MTDVYECVYKMKDELIERWLKEMCESECAKLIKDSVLKLCFLLDDDTEDTALVETPGTNETGPYEPPLDPEAEPSGVEVGLSMPSLEPEAGPSTINLRGVTREAVEDDSSSGEAV